jgi:hypothetical protein
MQKVILMLLAMLLVTTVSAQTPQAYKGVLMLYPVGAAPNDPPIKTVGWPKPYAEAEYGTCVYDLKTKADELNVIYVQAELAGGQSLGRWQGTCVKAQ